MSTKDRKIYFNFRRDQAAETKNKSLQNLKNSSR